MADSRRRGLEQLHAARDPAAIAACGLCNDAGLVIVDPGDGFARFPTLKVCWHDTTARPERRDLE